MSFPPPPPTEDGLSDQTILTVMEGAMISFYINFCFLICEIGMLSFGPKGQIRHTLDTMGHILAGPISFLGFLNGGFMSSFFFFMSLWHFMCDSGQSRPSLIRELPQNFEEFWVWFESCWLFLHHWYIGTFKLLSTDLNEQLDGIDLQSGSIRFLIRTWVLGATLSHLSFGMNALNMKGHNALRILSVFFRMGAAAAIVAGQYSAPTAVRMAYGWDLCWMTVILLLTLRKALCASRSVAPKQAPDDDEYVDARISMSDAQMALQARLVHRLRTQAQAPKKNARPSSIANA